MENAEHFLRRWREAGLLDEPTAGAIRQWEQGQEGGRKSSWQVLIALTLGGLLLGAGVLLFVAAHWDAVSPVARMLLVLAMLVLFHGAGLAVRERFAGLATALHAVGTVSAGAAIALLGQIFNLQEHWPSAILLWALCAAAGWLLLQDEFQQTLTLLLAPAWLVSEWSERASGYTGENFYLGRLLLVLGAVYLTVFLASKKRVLRDLLFSAGVVLLLAGVPLVTEDWSYAFQAQPSYVPLALRVTAIVLMLLTGAAGWWAEKRSLGPIAVLAALGFVLPWTLKRVTAGSGPGQWTHTEAMTLTYLLTAAAAVYLVWWGVRVTSKGVVNFGMVAFALTVSWFYFSDIMGKLGRSLGLMLMGVLFLGGGWALEQMRRALISRMAGGAA